MELTEDRENLDNFTVGSVPTLIYIPNFITDVEEEQLLDSINKAPVSKWKSLKNRRLQNWGGIVHEKGLLPQDLPPWLTRITEKIGAESGLFPAPINHVLINEYHPNQGIMPHQDGPAYHPVVAILSLGSPVVMNFTPHSSFEEGSVTLDNDERKTISENFSTLVSAGESFNDYQPFSVVIMPRSLLIFKDKAYSDYLHGIKDCVVQQIDEAVNFSQIAKSRELLYSAAGSEIEIDADGGNRKFIHRKGTRISLTCRLVPKAHKNLFKL